MKLVARAVFATFLTTVASGVWPGMSVAAQDETQASPPNPQRMHQDMMAMRKQMIANRQEAQTRLQTLLDQMRRAEGDTRLDAISALLTELAEQQLAHLEHSGRMMGMMEQMMGGRMGGGRGPAERKP